MTTRWDDQGALKVGDGARASETEPMTVAGSAAPMRQSRPVPELTFLELSLSVGQQYPDGTGEFVAARISVPEGSDPEMLLLSLRSWLATHVPPPPLSADERAHEAQLVERQIEQLEEKRAELEKAVSYWAGLELLARVRNQSIHQEPAF